MDVSTIGIMIIIAIGILLSFECGYYKGKRRGVMEYKLGVTTMPTPGGFSFFPKKDAPYRERDPWDELRIDIPDTPGRLQTLPEEKINE
jgi:hypothetical protein